MPLVLRSVWIPHVSTLHCHFNLNFTYSLGAANAQYSFILALGLSISDLRSINFHCSGPKAALIQINLLQALG
jgi:hypothetical protein